MLLLFAIGLEIKPSRLWSLRREVFGLGSLQIVITASAITGLPCGMIGHGRLRFLRHWPDHGHVFYRPGHGNAAR